MRNLKAKNLYLIIFGLVFFFLSSGSYAIDISNCQIINESQVYYLITDVWDASNTCFEIQTSNVTLDCQGHVIDGNFTGYGVYINAYDYGNLSNVTIKNCTLQEFGVGLYIRSFDINNKSDNITGMYLNISNNLRVGILMEKSYNFSLFNSILQNNGNVYLTYTPFFYIPYKGGFYSYLSNYSYWKNIILHNNSDDGIDIERSFYFNFYNVSISHSNDAGVDVNEGCFHTFSKVRSYNNGWLDIYFSLSDPQLCNNIFYDVNSTHGKVIYYANLRYFNNFITTDNISYFILCNVSNSSFYGLKSKGGSNMIYYSYNVSFYNSFISQAYYGFYIKNSSSLTFVNNTILDSKYSYKLYGVNSSVFNRNILLHNYYGLHFSYVFNNLFYNNFFNNTLNAYIYEVSFNHFNTTLTKGPNIVGRPFIAGNVWAKPDGTGFSETCTDADHDGICDSSYDTGYGIDYA
ncbi:MAG: hypothetical protein GXN99_02875, partial [Candidatus Nanohaloarchaeota archaeon]|nr:hypothetical protein [Candidatus Nanohaloarchaeota archaeon]